jgi:DNA-binding response OmpR family regulator
LIFLDIQLPGKNGMSLLKRIKDTAKDCEVIMLTNYAGESLPGAMQEIRSNVFFG